MHSLLKWVMHEYLFKLLIGFFHNLKYGVFYCDNLKTYQSGTSHFLHDAAPFKPWVHSSSKSLVDQSVSKSLLILSTGSYWCTCLMKCSFVNDSWLNKMAISVKNSYTCNVVDSCVNTTLIHMANFYVDQCQLRCHEGRNFNIFSRCNICLFFSLIYATNFHFLEVTILCTNAKLCTFNNIFYALPNQRVWY